ncbi:MAG: hypothetical protein EAZ89_19760 [Bacteroidetes bacterium]|nr:MAG: hypothetical protein EAZ89_19760 [Bacteroidota bacterium]
MKKILLLLPLFLQWVFAQVPSTPNDGDWSLQSLSLRNTPEAELMIRSGDIDNLGFGFPEGFDPFCERSTEAHYFPWEPVEGNAPGTDRIMLPSSYTGNDAPCGADGYSGSFSDQTRVQQIELSLAEAKGITIRSALLQLFLDDFQAPVLCTKFQMTLNGRRFAEGEKLLNSINQTGPIGKVLSFPLSADFFDLFASDKLTIRIDDPSTGSGDGFAIDFAKLLINHKGYYCKGIATGLVMIEFTETPIANATVELRNYGQVTTDAQGRFTFSELPAGLHPITAYAKGYNSGGTIADVWASGAEDVYIYLSQASKEATYAGKTLREGESVSIYNIQFDLASADIRPDARAELDKIYTFLTENTAAEIELSGHTSSDGDDASNKALSLRRVQSCKAYLVRKGIDDGRIFTRGYGEERPLAANDTESNRAKNRRVEMRVLKL